MNAATRVAAASVADERLLQPAHVLAASVRAGDVTSRALVDGYLARIARIDGALNAVVVVDADGARAQAEAMDARIRAALERGEADTLPPLAGVPVTIKDMYSVAGLRTTYGIRALAHYVSPVDATVVARLRAAGAVVLGKTNIPEASFDWQCDSPVYGRTRNPWDVRRTPGGSSGGAAAAVAAGLSALDVGSDVAGSIRLPAHYCGVYGMKPTEFRVSGAGHGDVRDGLRAQAPRVVPRAALGDEGVRGIRSVVSFGPLARSVRDLETVLLAIAGADPRRPEVPPVPVERAAPRPLSEYRLAVTDDVPGVPLDADTRRVMRETVASLERAGARIDRVPAPMDFLDACDTWGRVIGAEMGAALPHAVRLGLRTVFAVRFGAVRWGRSFARGLSDSLHQYEGALARREVLVRAVETLLAGYDGWLLPVASTPAFEHCRTGASLPVDGDPVAYGLAAGALVVPLSLTGQPVVTIPAGASAAGLPIGVQLVGRKWSDFELLALAGRVDEVMAAFRGWDEAVLSARR